MECFCDTRGYWYPVNQVVRVRFLHDQVYLVTLGCPPGKPYPRHTEVELSQIKKHLDLGFLKTRGPMPGIDRHSPIQRGTSQSA